MDLAPKIAPSYAHFDELFSQMRLRSGPVSVHNEGAILPCVRWVFPRSWLSDVAMITKLCHWAHGFDSLSIAPLVRPGDYVGLEFAGAPLESIYQSLQWDNSESLIIHSPLPQLSEAGLLVMDMDSTAIAIECIDELAAMAGVGADVAAVTELAMQGELDFEQSLRRRVKLLAGADERIITDLCQRLPLTPGLAVMCQTLKDNGWKLVLASGGFTPFVSLLQHKLGLDDAYANQLEIINGKLTGQVLGEIVDANYKASVLTQCAQRWHIAQGQRLAIGDGANDIPMLLASDFGIAFHAKPKLQSVAAARINRLDLQTLLFWLQA
ncbi:MAG: phosphoserine phosphatase SerB [Shewanella sp.]